jgi:ATP-dependent protease ClpP protease subunit
MTAFGLGDGRPMEFNLLDAKVTVIQEKEFQIFRFDGSLAPLVYHYDLSKVYKASKKLDRFKPVLLVLNSPGGEPGFVEELWEIIRFRTVNAPIVGYVPRDGQCGSACTYLYAMTDYRIAHSQASFYFHLGLREVMEPDYYGGPPSHTGRMKPMSMESVIYKYVDYGLDRTIAQRIRESLEASGGSEVSMSAAQAAQIGFVQSITDDENPNPLKFSVKPRIFRGRSNIWPELAFNLAKNKCLSMLISLQQ